MADINKKGDSSKKPAPYEKWLEKLAPQPGQAPTGVTTYIGLLRESPSDADAYQLYQTLDMASSLHIRKEDVLHLEDLPADKSPFGTLGGSKVFVRRGARITSVRTASNTFEAGSAVPDDFDLDIRLGARRPVAATANSIPFTACGDECGKLPPFSDPDAGGCKVNPFTPQCTNLTPCIPDNPTGYSVCACGLPTVECVTVAQTCDTNCGTCHTNCGTCQTQCGTCNTCLTHCQTCGPCTHQLTRCNQRNCQKP
jgi:hypothetical protein